MRENTNKALVALLRQAAQLIEDDSRQHHHSGLCGQACGFWCVPRALSIKTAGERKQLMIAAGTQTPASASETFTTPENHQKAVDVQLVEAHEDGDRTLLAMRLDVKPQSRFEPRIEVTVHVDVDGVAHLTVLDAENGRPATCSVRLGRDSRHDERELILTKKPAKKKPAKKKKPA